MFNLCTVPLIPNNKGVPFFFLSSFPISFLIFFFLGFSEHQIFSLDEKIGN
jgi:hypothetical protein